jgi:hypothetical protein
VKGSDFFEKVTAAVSEELAVSTVARKNALAMMAGIRGLRSIPSPSDAESILGRAFKYAASIDEPEQDVSVDSVKVISYLCRAIHMMAYHCVRRMST